MFNRVLNLINPNAENNDNNDDNSQNQDNSNDSSTNTPSAEELRRIRLSRFESQNISPSSNNEENKKKDKEESKKDNEVKEEKPEKDNQITNNDKLKEEEIKEEPKTEEIIKDEPKKEDKKEEIKDKQETISIKKEELKQDNNNSSSFTNKQPILSKPTGPIPSSWEDEFITKIFNVTVQPEHKSRNITFLQHLHKDLKLSKQKNLLSVSYIDRIIVEQLSYHKKYNNEPFTYLLQSLHSLQSESRRIRSIQKKFKIASSIETIIINYCVLLATNPFLFNEFNDSSYDKTILKDLLECLSSSSLPSRVLGDFIDRVSDLNKLSEVFLPLFKLLLDNSKTASIVDNSASDIINIYTDLMNFKSIANEIISNDTNWLIDGNGHDIQCKTYLGALLSFGCIPTRDSNKVALTHFMDPLSLSRATKESIGNSLRIKMHDNCENIYKSIMNLIRTFKDKGKEAWLSWLAKILDSNKGITKMRPDPNILSSYSTLLNLGYLCICFCRPIIKQGDKAFSKIDPAYLQSNIRINVENETKLAINSEELDTWVDKRNLSYIETWKRKNPGLDFDESKFKKTEQAGFTSECFFLTYRALHLGLLRSIITVRDNLYRPVQNMQTQLKSLQNSGGSEYEIKNLKTEINLLESIIECYQVHLFDGAFIKECGQFYIFATNWLLHLIDPKQKGLPLDKPTMEYGSMPEFIIEDIADYFSYGLKTFPSFLQWFSLEPVIILITLLVGSPSYVKNPYLRAKLLTVLTTIVLQSKKYKADCIGIFDSSSIVRNHLAEVLMAFYIDIEQTGHHNQYTNKFYVRQDITVVIKHLWNIPRLHNSILKASNEPKFVHFIFKLLDESLFFLEEGLRVLTEIHATEQEMKDTIKWHNQTKEEIDEKLDVYSKNEGKAKSFFQFAEGTVEMLHFLTSEIVEPFMKGEVVGRIANMLNYFLDQLAGPKCSELRVENKEKYLFYPKKLLGTMIDIYLHLWRPELVTAVGKDIRCYSHDTFIRAKNIIQKTQIRSVKVCNDIERFANDVKDSIEIDIDIEYPDEFLDPLMQEVMKDPVKLPSGINVDRAVIKQHLLTKETDPFTNLPLTEDQLIPNTELKLQIEEYTKKKIEEYKTNNTII